MDSGWFGLVLSKSYPTATPMQCSLENIGHLLDFKSTKPMDEARQQLEVHGVSSSRSLECTQLGGVGENLPSSIAVENHPIVKLIYCK